MDAKTEINETKKGKQDDWIDPRRMRKARKMVEKARRKKAIEAVIIGPTDSAVIVRGNGRVQITHARGEVRVGNSAFWGMLLNWLFKDDADAAERRQILIDDFMVDLQLAQQKAQEKLDAEKEPAIAEGPAHAPGHE